MTEVRSTTRSALVALVALALIAGAGTPASAAKRQPRHAERALKTGLEHYARGDYEAAVLEFERAYELAPRSAALLHLARAHAAMGACPQALAVLARYLRASLKPKERRAAEALERTCTAAVAQATSEEPVNVDEVDRAREIDVARDVDATEGDGVARGAPVAEPVTLFAEPAADAAESGRESQGLAATRVDEAPAVELAPWHRSMWLWTLVGTALAAGAGAAAVMVR